MAAIDQLLRVRQETMTLQQKIQQLNQKMSESGASIISRKKELVGYKRVLVNCETGLEVIKACLHVLDISYKINVQIECRKYYSALRMLDDLQHDHLKQIVQYSFAQRLQSSIGSLRDNIKEAVLSEMNDWLVLVRETSRPLGRLAMENTKSRQASVRAQREAALQTEYTTATNMDIAIEIAMLEENTVDIFDLVQLDFRPLYQCCHIHTVLGRIEEFKAFYEENREVQLVLPRNKPRWFSSQTGTLRAAK